MFGKLKKLTPLNVGLLLIAVGLLLFALYDPTIREVFTGTTTTGAGGAGAFTGFTAADAATIASAATTAFEEQFAAFTLCLVGFILVVAGALTRPK